MGASYWVYARGSWRRLDVSSGRVSGWAGRPRFCFYRRGRLQLAGSAAVLRGLRSLLEARPTTIRDGLPLSQRRHSVPRPRKRSPVRCCCRHRCLPHSDNSRSALVQLNLSTQCANSTQTSLSALQPLKADAAVQANENVERRVGSRTKELETNTAVCRVLAGNESESSVPACKELIVNEEDVAALRSFLEHDNTFNVDLHRFDTDDDYKSHLFYKINPLVCVERCRRIADMLTQRAPECSLSEFTRSLGLRSVHSLPNQPRHRMRRRRDDNKENHTGDANTNKSPDKLANKLECKYEIPSDTTIDTDSEFETYFTRNKTNGRRDTKSEYIGNQSNSTKVDVRSKYLIKNTRVNEKEYKNKQKNKDSYKEKDKSKDINANIPSKNQTSKFKNTKNDKDLPSSDLPSSEDDSNFEKNNVNSEVCQKDNPKNTKGYDRSRDAVKNRSLMVQNLFALEIGSDDGDKVSCRIDKDGARERRDFPPTAKSVAGVLKNMQKEKRKKGETISSPTKSVDNKRTGRRAKNMDNEEDSSEERRNIHTVLSKSKDIKKRPDTGRRRSDRLKDNSPTKSIDSRSQGRQNSKNTANLRDDSEDSDFNDERSNRNDRKNRFNHKKLRSQNNSPIKSVDSRSRNRQRNETLQKSSNSSEDSDFVEEISDKNDRLKLRSKNNLPTKIIDDKTSQRIENSNNKTISDSSDDEATRKSDRMRSQDDSSEKSSSKLLKERNIENVNNKRKSGRLRIESDSKSDSEKKSFNNSDCDKNNTKDDKNNDKIRSKETKNEDAAKKNRVNPGFKDLDDSKGVGADNQRKRRSTANTQNLFPSQRREYSSLEDHAIVAWLSLGSRARKVNGNMVWRELQSQFSSITGCHRTWHSLRNRYLRSILPSLGSLSLPSRTVSELRAAQAAGEIKSRRRPQQPNPLLSVPAVRSAWAHRPRTVRRTSADRTQTDRAPTESPPKRALRSSLPSQTDKQADKHKSKQTDKQADMEHSPTYSELTRKFAAKSAVSTPEIQVEPDDSISPPAKRTRKLFNPKMQL